jgi:carbonic anhydrase
MYDLQDVGMNLSDLLANHRKLTKNITSDDKLKYQQLADGQQPIAMLITCVDSRIMPEQLLGLEPGQLFCLRNIASLVSRQGTDSSTESAIQYAVNHLGIKNIIVMGHSKCGGINALVNNAGDGAIDAWLQHWRQSAQNWLNTPHEETQCFCQKQAVLESMQNIKDMNFISDEINILGWHLDIGNAQISAYDLKENKFLTI